MVIQIGLNKNSHFLALDADIERKLSLIRRPPNKKLNITEGKTGLHISPAQSAKHSEAALRLKLNVIFIVRMDKKNTVRIKQKINNLDFKRTVISFS